MARQKAYGAERRTQKRKRLTHYSFRIKLTLGIILLGLLAVWGSYYARLTNERRNWNISLTSTIGRQAHSVADLLSAVHSAEILGLKTRADIVNARLIQNENILLENSQYTGTLPNISIQHMISDDFVIVNRALIENQEAIRFIEQFYVNDNRYNFSPQSAYIVDSGAAGGLGNTSRERGTHVARILGDSTRVESIDSRERWLGLYIRGSDAVPYDRMLQGNIVAGQLVGSNVDYFAGAPIYDLDRNIIAMVVLEYDITTALSALQQSRLSGIQFYGAISVIYILLAIFLLHLIFRPLRSLLHNALSIRRNDLNSKAFLKGNNELSLIGKSMDYMTEKLDGMVYDLQSVNRAHRHLFPSVYLNFLEKESVGELEIGEYTDRYVVILVIKVHYPDILRRRTSSAADTIELINDTVQYVQSEIDVESGFIESFTAHELLVFFLGNADVAMETAKNLHAKTAQWNVERRHNHKTPIELSMALHRGTVSFGIVGEEHLVKPHAASYAIETTRQLADIGERLGSPLITTDTFSVNLLKSMNYQFRYLGSALLNMKNSLQVMEEIDVYPENLRKVIAVTRIDFEEGVKNFERKYLSRAQDIFDVLAIQSPDDKVVKVLQGYIHQHAARAR